MNYTFHIISDPVCLSALPVSNRVVGTSVRNSQDKCVGPDFFGQWSRFCTTVQKIRTRKCSLRIERKKIGTTYLSRVWIPDSGLHVWFGPGNHGQLDCAAFTGEQCRHLVSHIYYVNVLAYF